MYVPDMTSTQLLAGNRKLIVTAILANRCLVILPKWSSYTQFSWFSLELEANYKTNSLLTVD